LDSLLGMDATSSTAAVNISTASPFFMAAWIGFFITGINMMPISQLDGGHIAFGIFGEYASWIAKATFVFAVFYLIWSGPELYGLSLMLLLILIMGVSHPPSSNDRQSIGLFRTILGLATMSLPIFCIAAVPFHF
jgi:membrane-associated protease RseP (regulator of RpoE activity)